MKLLKKAGATSEIWQVFIADSSSTTGAGLTGLTQASAGLTAYYHRDTDTTATAITLVTMTVGTFTSSGFKEIDATNMPGWYQFCPPNAALAAGAKSCAFLLKGATNMVPLPIEAQLSAVDPDSTAFGLSLAKTTNLTGLNDIAATDVWAAATRTLTAGTNIALAKGTGVTGFNDITAASVWAVLLSAITASDGSIGGLLKADIDAAISSRSTYAGADTAGTTTLLSRLTSTRAGNLDNLDATVSSRLASSSYTAPPSASTNAAAVWDEARASHTTAGTFGQGVASVQGSVTGSVASVTGAVGSIASGGITAASHAAGAIDAAALATDAGQEIADRVLARSLATGSDGGRTVQDALRVLRNKVAISGGTMTVTQEDDTTTAWTASVTTTAGNPVTAIDPA